MLFDLDLDLVRLGPFEAMLDDLDALLAGVFVPLAGALRRLLETVVAADLLLRADERDGPVAEDEAGEFALEDDFDEAGVAERSVVVIEVSPFFSVMYFGFWTLGVDGVLLLEEGLLCCFSASAEASAPSARADLDFRRVDRPLMVA